MNIDGYKEKIVETLNNATQPLDIEKIRIESEIGHWTTTLKNCLELMIDKKICGIKTSKSWVFWTEKNGATDQ